MMKLQRTRFFPGLSATLFPGHSKQQQASAFLEKLGVHRIDVDIGTSGLLVLIFSRNMVYTAILAKIGACLFEMKGNLAGQTLLPNAKHPAIIAETRVHP